MKKVLVLMLVLGMASLANAGLVYQIAGVNYAAGSTINVTPGIVTVTLVNDAQISGPYSLGGLFAADGVTNLVGGAVVAANLPGTWSLADAGAFAAVDLGLPEGPAGYLTAISNDVPAVGVTKAGPLFSFDVSFAGPHATVEVLDSNLGQAYGGITLTPEPATMLILGLGGLLLRRKK